jgi:hypothetical protein
MGFTKRYYTAELILKQINNQLPLNKYFNVDALIFNDNISSMAYEEYKKGKSDKEIEEFIINELETKR